MVYISLNSIVFIGILCFVIGAVARWVVDRVVGAKYSGAIDFDISTEDHKASFVFYEPIENFEQQKSILLKVTKHR